MVTLPAYREGAALQSCLDNYTVSNLLAANVPEFVSVPTDENGKLARYVTFGKGAAADFYAQGYSATESADRVTNGTFAEYVTNGAFASDTGWTKGTGWSITGGKAVVSGAQVASTDLTQTSAIALLNGYSYTLTYTTALTTHVTNGTFAADTDWTEGSGWSIAAGVATAVTSSAALSQTAAVTLVAGRSYTVTFDATRSAGSVVVSIGGTAGTSRSTSATFTEVIVAGATQTIAFTGTGFSGTLDNVVVTALGNITASVGGTAGTARSTAATFIEAILAGSTQAITFTADANFVGTIDNATVTAWVLGTGWTTDGATAIATGAISTALSQTINPTYALVQGQAYLVTYTTSSVSAGTITVSLGGTAGTGRTTSATFAEVIIAGSTQALSFGTSGFTGLVDNVIVKEVPSTPADATSGLSGEQNPPGYFLNSNVSVIGIVSAGTPIVTMNFYK